MTTGSSKQAMTFTAPPQIRYVSTSILPKARTVGENPLQPLRPGYCRMTPNWRLLVLAICDFGLATLAPSSPVSLAHGVCCLGRIRRETCLN